MVLNTLESLVLRNVNANSVSTADMLRCGPSYQGTIQTPESPISKRHPSPGRVRVFMQPAKRLEDAMLDGVVDAVNGAGRSHGLAGVLSRRSAAQRAARAGHRGRLLANGGALPSVISCLSRIAAKQGLTGGSGNAWCKTTQVPPASTRGKGVR